MEQTRSQTTQATAQTVSFEDYMEHYAAHFYEWVKGQLIPMSPVTLKQDSLTGYLYMVASAYFALNSIGVVLQAPFVMKVDATESGLEPDLQIILHTNPGKLTETAMIGPADICIEVVSPESVAHDYGDKFVEYEAGGVSEYWLFDPLRKTSRFHRLGDDGRYHEQTLDSDGYYRTPLLPKFALYVPSLWEERLPNLLEVVEAMKRLFEES